MQRLLAVGKEGRHPVVRNVEHVEEPRRRIPRSTMSSKCHVTMVTQIHVHVRMSEGRRWRLRIK